MLFKPTQFAVALLLLALFGAGCEMETYVVRSTWDQWGAEWRDNSTDTRGTYTSSNGGRLGYAIQLARFSGDNQFTQVHRLITDARQEAGLAGLWYASTGRETSVYAGRFAESDSPEAKAMLQQVRQAQINGSKPFKDAKIVSASGGRDEVLDPRDLRSLKGRGLYSLQIGYFDGGFGPNFRRAAETAVDVLREQGEDAYYYHGPHRSMVLVNAWTYAEAFTREGQVDRYSNMVRSVQVKHPHNVPNGRPFTESDDPALVASQRSFLVPIR